MEITSKLGGNTDRVKVNSIYRTLWAVTKKSVYMLATVKISAYRSLIPRATSSNSGLASVIHMVLLLHRISMFGWRMEDTIGSSNWIRTARSWAPLANLDISPVKWHGLTSWRSERIKLFMSPTC